MAAAHAALSEARRALETFSADVRGRAEREDLLRFQLGELDAAQPVAGEDDELRALRERLKGAERFFAVAARGEDMLLRGRRAPSPSCIAAVARELAPLAPSSTPAPRAAARAARRRAGRRRGRGARSGQVRARHPVRSRAPRRDRGAAAPAPAALPQARRHGRRSRREARGVRARARRARLVRGGPRGAQGRGRAGRGARARGRRRAVGVAPQGRDWPREEKVGATLRELGFVSARLPVAVEARDLGASGADLVRFLFAPNPGDPPRPLAKIASGGGLARVLLAGKQALARTDPCAHVRLRRGRRGHRWRRRRDRRGASSRRSRATGRSSSSRTFRRWRRSRTPTCASRRRPRAAARASRSRRSMKGAERAGELARTARRRQPVGRGEERTPSRCCAGPARGEPPRGGTRSGGRARVNPVKIAAPPCDPQRNCVRN